MITSEQWDWGIGDDDDVVVREQLATAVYRNTRGEIVIRQKADAYDDGDTIVLLAPDNAARLARKLLEIVGDDGEFWQAPTPKTPAQRQRTYRQRHAVTAGMTETVTETVTPVVLSRDREAA